MDALLLRSGTEPESLLPLLLFNAVLGILDRVIRQENLTKGIKIRMEDLISLSKCHENSKDFI